MRYALRDTDVLIYSVLVPLLLYPGLVIGASEVFLWQLSSPEQKSRIAVLDTARLPQPMLAALQRDKTLQISQPKEPMLALEKGALDAVISMTETPTRMEFLVFTAGRKSFFAVQNIEQTVRSAQLQAQTTVFRERNLSPSVLNVVKVSEKRLLPGIPTAGGAENVEGTPSMMAMAVVLLGLVQAGLTSGITAVCMLAEEKEKNTFETTVTLPVATWWLIVGKWLTATTLSTFSAIVNIITLSGSFIVILVQTLAIKKIDWRYMLTGVHVDPLMVFYALACLSIGSAFCAALCLAAVAYCRNFKDGQAMATYPMLAAISLPLITMAPGIEKNWWTVFIPVTNLVLCVKHPQSSSMFLLESTILSAAAIAVCLWIANKIYFAQSSFTGAAASSTANSI